MWTPVCLINITFDVDHPTLLGREGGPSVYFVNITFDVDHPTLLSMGNVDPRLFDKYYF